MPGVAAKILDQFWKTSGTYVATMKELSEYFYATGSMKLPYLDVAQAAGGLSNITACTVIAITQ